MLSFRDRNDIKFSWEELNCILRPTYHICEALNPGYGLLFLFLTSFYRSNGLENFFIEKEKNYFLFLKQRISELINLDFTLDAFSDIDQMVESVFSSIYENSIIVFPGNMIDLFYAKYYKKRNWAHYFHVVSIDSDVHRAHIIDNLHLTHDILSTEYANFYLTKDMIKTLIKSYESFYLMNSKSNAFGLFHGQPGLWLLTLKQRDNRRNFLDSEIAGLLLNEYVKLQGLKLSNNVCVTSYENNDINILKQFVRTDLKDNEKKNIMTQYLASTNFNEISNKILSFLIKKSRKYNQDSLAMIDKFSKKIKCIRAHSLIKFQSDLKISDDFWEEQKNELDFLKSKREEILLQIIKKIKW